MGFDIKALAVFLPLLAAILFGMNYAIYGRILQTVNVQTLFTVSMLFNTFIACAVYVLFPGKINFAPLMQSPLGWFLLLGLIAGLAGWICTLSAMRNVSATYAAIGELSYPIFTAFFAYLIFQSRELDWKMALGGAFIMIGTVIVISDQIKMGSNP